MEASGSFPKITESMSGHTRCQFVAKTEESDFEQPIGDFLLQLKFAWAFVCVQISDAKLS